MHRPSAVKTVPEKEKTRTRGARHIKDARGCSVTQLDPVAMYLLHRNGGVIPHEVLRELTREIGFGKLDESRLGIWGGVVALVCALVLVGSGLMQLHKGSILFVEFAQRALLYQGIWIVPLAFWKSARRSRFHRIHKIMLEHIRCPHCGYDMRLLPTDPQDGATVCPECGCAWKLGNAKIAGGHGDG